MKKTNTASKLIPIIVVAFAILLFTGSFLRAKFLVRKSEKELNPKKQIEEAQTKEFSLKEIDGETGVIRWKLTAKEGTTQNNLQSALIKEVKAQVYKNNEVIFELDAPRARANAPTKEIYLFGEVTAKNKNGTFLLKSNQLALGMGTSIEAQKGFKLFLKTSGEIIGENALINDDQTKIVFKDLQEALFKDLELSGKEVSIERDSNGELINALITNGGKVVLKKSNNDTLSANTIQWKRNGDIEATNNVIYNSSDKTFKAGYLFLKPDGKVYAKYNVEIVRGPTKCFGNSLSYENNSLIVIKGNPKAIQGDKQIIADKIIYDLNTDKVEAVGNVKTIVSQKDNKILREKT